MTANTLPNLGGYNISEVLYEGSKSLVYRGIRLSDHRPVVIKLLKRTLPTHNELLEFRHQYNLLKDIHIEGIISPLALESWQEKLALVMPDDGSLDLLNYMHGQPLNVADFLTVAMQLSDILSRLHQEGITHKDIKPANILIQPEKQQVMLIDFSIASKLSSESQSLQSPDTLSGTLNYLSPEQTGRMNRGVDYRTDFYSLGVTFYQMLSGQLPFITHDTLELVHSHLAKAAPSLLTINPDIPQVLNDMVQKLIAKNAEDRYQSAEGLLADLQRCQEQLQVNGIIQPFTLGQGDVSRHFNIPENLYGRFNEVKNLLDAFERVCDGNLEVVMISGISGIGKTALVNEVHKPMTRSRGYFVQGKFDQFKRDTPFFALTQALRMLVCQLLDERDEQKQQWREQILAGVGDQGQLLVNLVPELQQLIGEQPDVEDLQGEAAAHRFHHLMAQFLQVFTSEAHPLVLFLDDLQWIDNATLKLLSILLEPGTGHHLLFIGAYRDNETLAGHPLLLALGHIQQCGVPVSSIGLNPLNGSDLMQLVADTCHCSLKEAEPLSLVVMEKTSGNPFFSHQFLLQAWEQSLISYDFVQERWCYDLVQIKQLAASADVVDFMAAKLCKQAPNIQQVLQLAACIGIRFELATLARVMTISQSHCADHCWQAVQEKLLIPEGDDYKLVQDSKDESEIEKLQVRYRFAHDRIQQAAYFLIPESQKALTHLNIGRLLKQQMSLERQHEWLFDVVNQLNAGKALITATEERLELAKLNYRAGQKAKRATAYEAARQYIYIGLELLDTKVSWRTEYSLTLGLSEAAAEVALLQGDYNTQRQWTEEVLNHSESLIDSIKIHQMHCVSLVAQNDPVSAIQYALPILKQCGIEFPAQPTPDDFQIELDKTQLLLKGRSIVSLSDLPLMKDPIVLAGVRLIEKLNVALYMATPALYPLAVFKLIQLAIKYGNAPEIVPFYGAYGYLLSGLVNDIETGYAFGQLSLTLMDKLQARAQKPLILTNVYGPLYFKKPIRDCIAPMREASHNGLESGDLHFAATDAMWASFYSYFAGEELSTLEKNLANSNHFIEEMHQDACLGWNQMLHQVVLNLMGDSEQTIRLQGASYNETISLPQYLKAGDRFSLCAVHLHQAILAYLFLDVHQSVSAVNEAWNFLDAATGTLYVPELHFYDPLIRLALYPEQSEQEQTEWMKKIISCQEKMQFWAQYAPMNFQHKWTLVEAECCRVLDEPLAAMAHYDQAINLAQENQFVQEEALACELAGRFYLARNQQTVAQAYLTRAYYAWARWGAKAKTDQMQELYPELLERQARKDFDSETSASTTSGSSPTTTANMDLDSVIKSSQSLSSELSLAGLMDKLLNALMENAGAQRTVLMLNDSPDKAVTNIERWQVVAESSIEQQIQTVLDYMVLDDYQALPKKLLEHVIAKNQAVVLDDARDPYQPFYNDPYFVKDRQLNDQAQKSVLCQPVLSQGRLIGLLYLENKLTTHVFHKRRLKLIQMTASQAAISIENANLYEHLEEKVRERTAQLKQAQTQLLKQARESGMAEIAIEVMHNIGNALTPLKTKTEMTYSAMHNSELVNKAPQLMKLLAEALETNNNLDSTERQKLIKITEILPNVIATDYKSHAENLEEACDTIRRIEEFIHLQSKYATVKPMNDYLDVNELCKDALKMLDNLLQLEHVHVELQLSKLPPIYAEEYQLLQIILGVIKNATEAMASIAIYDRKLIIHSRLEKSIISEKEDIIMLQIQDNGTGFKPELKQRIFAADYISSKKQIFNLETAKTSGFKLHTCANYLIASGGKIEANSEGEGKGAVFTITLPVKKNNH